MDRANKTYDVLHAEIHHANRIMLRSKELKYAKHVHAVMTQYPGVYLHTSDQSILITYGFS